MAGFVQIIEYKSSRYEELAALGEKFRAEREAAGDAMPPEALITTADRDRPGYYLTIVRFDSYEEAMENSRRDDTSAFAAQMSELCDEPPKFYNLDVLDQS
jgi:hypothetical protein